MRMKGGWGSALVLASTLIVASACSRGGSDEPEAAAPEASQEAVAAPSDQTLQSMQMQLNNLQQQMIQLQQQVMQMQNASGAMAPAQ